MKRNLFIFFVIVGNVVLGQSWLWNMPTVLSDTSIIRQWREHEYIIYSRQGSGAGVVAYYDFASGTIQRATLPSGVIINDFRIANDTVFAGGSYIGGTSKVGLVACFAINDLLNGSGVFHACQLSNRSMAWGFCYTPMLLNLITGVNRISLFQDGMSTRVAFVADNVIVDVDNPNSVYFYRKGYGDFAFKSMSPSSKWEMGEYYYHKHGEEWFSDIAVTSSKIVIVARSRDSSLLSFQVFDKQTNYASYLGSPYSDVYCYNDHILLDDPMVTMLKRDSFAVAYHCLSSANAYCLAVKVFSMTGGVPVLLGSLEIPIGGMYSGNWKMRDIRYIEYFNQLLVLNDVTSPLSGYWSSYIYQMDIGNLYAGPYKVRSLLNQCLSFSLDFFSFDGFVESAADNSMGNLVVHEEVLPAPVTCGEWEEITKSFATSPSMHLHVRPQCTIRDTVYDDLFIPFTASEEQAILRCSRNIIINY